MSDESSASSPADLASIDLALSFGPAWAKGSSIEHPTNLTAHHDFEDSREHVSKRRNTRNSSGPRSNRQDNRNSTHPNRRPGKHEEQQNERRSKPQTPQPLTGWEVRFLPDKHGVDGLAKQIKSISKAYPLFDLAQLVLEKSERYLVEFKRISDTAPAIFQLKTDGSLWLSEREAISHVLTQHLDKFYYRERISVEPPKGVYTSVAQCGLSGVLLGPSNYHDYQLKLIKLHAERFPHMPFESFKSRIRMVHDEESIAKWKEEQSFKEVFYPLDNSSDTQPNGPRADTAVIKSRAAELPPVIEPAIPNQEVEGGTITKESVTSSKSENIQENTSRLRLESLADVERHFRENHAAVVIAQIGQKIIAPGSPSMNSSSRSIHLLARYVWEDFRRFPLPLAHILGQQLTARGVQIFKAHKNITYAGPARPRYLNVETTKISKALSDMLAYIEAHPSVPRAEQWKALVALRMSTSEDTKTQYETAVAADLFWLLHEGHVIDYAKRGLEIAPRPKASVPMKKSVESSVSQASGKASLIADASRTLNEEI